VAEVTFDVDKLTPRLLGEFAEQTGVELMSLVDKAGEIDMQRLGSKELAGCIWLAMRTSGRDDATFEQALDTPLSALTFSDDEEPDPTPASGPS